MAYQNVFSSGYRPLTWPIVVRNGIGSGTLTGHITLTHRDAQFLRLDPGGADRNVTLPAGRDGALICIFNAADAEEDLAIKNPAGTTLVTIPRDGSALLGCEDVTWGLVLQGTEPGADRPAVIADPGDAGAIPVASSGVCALTSAGAETRTLAIPSFLGQRLTLVCDTYVGDIVVTAASPVNVANNNTLTFGAVSEALELVAVSVGGTLAWQVGWNDGVGLTTV